MFFSGGFAAQAAAPALETVSSPADGSLSVSADEAEGNPGKADNQVSISPSPAKVSSKNSPVVIMLAEDNPGDAQLVSEAIDHYKFPAVLHVLKDGEKAFQFIQNAEAGEPAPCPTLALLDLNLPKKNGFEILQRIRESPKCCNIPVVIITSSDSPKDRANAARSGANRYFRKPSTYDEFLELGQVIQDVIGEQRQKLEQ